MKVNFKQLLKVSAFYLEKQKSFIRKKKISSRCQYQNKKALLTPSIFQEGFGLHGFATAHSCEELKSCMVINSRLFCYQNTDQ